MSTAAHTILGLPPELILDISDHLPPDAILALKFAHSTFNNTLPLAPRLRNITLTDCARLAIRTYLSNPDTSPSRTRCILCKSVYPNALFKASSSSACLPLSPVTSSRIDIVELPHRFCSWHVGRLAKVVNTGLGGRNEWVSHKRDMCMHCGAIQGWADCNCDCNSCGVRRVRTYTRYLNNAKECRRFWFWRDGTSARKNKEDSTSGDLFVRETCFDGDTPHPNFIINIPVRYDDDIEKYDNTTKGSE